MIGGLRVGKKEERKFYKKQKQTNNKQITDKRHATDRETRGSGINQ